MHTHPNYILSPVQAVKRNSKSYLLEIRSDVFTDEIRVLGFSSTLLVVGVVDIATCYIVEAKFCYTISSTFVY